MKIIHIRGEFEDGTPIGGHGDYVNIYKEIILEQAIGHQDHFNNEAYRGDKVAVFWKGKFDYNAIIEKDKVNPCFCLRRDPERHGADVEYDFVACGLRYFIIKGNINTDEPRVMDDSKGGK
jgi:hypothetical protein